MKKGTQTIWLAVAPALMIYEQTLLPYAGDLCMVVQASTCSCTSSLFMNIQYV